jgi:multidrug efflux pump subunit AcrA (membrane-fusion protein)
MMLSIAAGLFTPTVLSAQDAPSRVAGILESAEAHTIRSTVAYPVTMLYIVPEGQAVKKGDLLLELDDTDLLEEFQEQEIRTTEAEVAWEAAAEALSAARHEAAGNLDLAEQALSLAKLALDGYIAGEYPLQVAEAENAVTLAAERENYATMRARQMEASADAPGDEVALAALELNEAKAELSIAQSRLQLLKDVLYGYRESELRLVVAEKQVALTRARNELQRADRDGEGTLKVARIRREIEDTRSDRLKNQLAACKVYAPRPGTVLYSRHTWGRNTTPTPLEPGTVVYNHQPLVELVDGERFKLDVPVSLDVARRVQPGHHATVRVDAFPRRTFEGRVAEVRVRPQVESPSAAATITVTLDDSTKQLRIGMSAVVEFSR